MGNCLSNLFAEGDKLFEGEFLLKQVLFSRPRVVNQPMSGLVLTYPPICANDGVYGLQQNNHQLAE